MKTLLSFINNSPVIASATAWYIESIAESKGRQELFTKQSPQKLKVLKEHALIESAVYNPGNSNTISRGKYRYDTESS